MVNKKVVIITVSLAIIIIATIVFINVKKLNNTNNDEINPIQENQNVNSSLNITESDLENNTTNDNVNDIIEQSNVIGQEEKESSEEINDTNKEANSESVEVDEKLTGKEKALNMAKKQWGKSDTTVYYYIDNVDGNIYNISVRSKTTTEALFEYVIDIKNNTIK